MFHTIFLSVSGIEWKMDLDLREWITWIFFGFLLDFLWIFFENILYISSEDYVVFWLRVILDALIVMYFNKKVQNFIEYSFYIRRRLIIELNREKYIIRKNIIIAINFLFLLLFFKFFFIVSLFLKTVFLVIINEKVVYL